MFDIQTIIERKDIPNGLVVNWDHIGINHVLVGNWTMVTEGLEWIKIDGLGDKKTVFAASLFGDFYCHNYYMLEKDLAVFHLLNSQ